MTIKNKFKLRVLFSLTSLVSINIAFANPVIPNDNRTQVNIVNNIPVIDIATPNISRVSHNVYKEFNTSEKGLVFNNSLNGTTSQLVGQLNKSPNLRNRPAGIIVNEVVGGNLSQLKGMIEVAGDRASVIISNPNGISINGLTFSDTIGEANFTTGTITFDKRKNLEESKVTKGHITIGEDGINTRNVNYLNLFSKTIKIDGDIEGDYVSVHAGGVLTDMKNLTYTWIESEGPKPEFSINTSDIGGIYANRIVLISTDKGTGVNLNDLDGKNLIKINAPYSSTVNINGVFRNDNNNITINANNLNDNGTKLKWSDDKNRWEPI
ncbi:filamentous hemagglutinin N-terminal domain-containing protein [Xenorhabdus budapestensis]|uniref:filamentous hemagglutinin N-terminal domain-containing protein n=1 Tax=Xenorhabdus budapestensis TaxID=290110 RepID=UPI003A853957